MIIIASKGLLLVHSTLFLINDKDFIIQGDIASSHTIPYCSLLSYGGPGTQTVTSKWAVGWDTFLASHRNFIVANIDVRGTGFQVSQCATWRLTRVTLPGGVQGSAFSHAVYGQLGSLEAEDTVAVIRELVRGHKYIDQVSRVTRDT